MRREELFTKFGIIRLVDSLTEKAYKRQEEHIYKNDLDNAPHGYPWHTSFHASEFPGDYHLACGRKAVYGLINIPSPQPMPRFLRAVASAGKSIEEHFVDLWSRNGILISSDITEQIQTGFTDEDYWLTGNMDAAILPPGWSRPHIVEVKTKSWAKIEEMKQGTRGPDDKHVLQCKTYIGLAHEQNPWPKLEPATTGSIYYVSRDDPSQTYEFQFEYEPEFMEAGRAKLKAWREAFIKEEIPDRPRLENNKLLGWSLEPCKYCPVKKMCKQDWKDENFDLSKSHTIEFAKSVRPNYDYEQTRKAVLDRWS